MLRAAWRTSMDLNRGLWAPVRILHGAGGAAAGAWRGTLGWLRRPVRRDYAPALALALVLFLLLYPLDGPIQRLLTGFRFGGDIRRELEAWQQFGALGSVLFAALMIWLLDAKRRARLLDLGVAVAANALLLNAIKLATGRPRPKFGDPHTFLGPTGTYIVEPEAGPDGIRSVWTAGSELWSMPSSHTAAAAVLAVFLATMYPALRTVMIVLTVLVAFSRVHTGAHWPTDVVVGGCLGYACGAVVVRRRLGMRLFRVREERALTAESPAEARADCDGAPADAQAPGDRAGTGTTASAAG